MVHNRDRPCFLVNPNTTHTYTPLSESSANAKETLDVKLSCPNAHHKVTNELE